MCSAYSLLRMIPAPTQKPELGTKRYPQGKLAN